MDIGNLIESRNVSEHTFSMFEKELDINFFRIYVMTNPGMVAVIAGQFLTCGASLYPTSPPTSSSNSLTR